jgi:type II secretory pathway pseudopilin PulG
MIIVVVIMLILFGIVASSLTGFARARKVRNSIERVATVLHVARSKAISDNAIYHVRVENRGPDNQWISIYRFPKASDALKAVSEADVQAIKGPDGVTTGWNPSSKQKHPVTGQEYSNYRVEAQGLEPGVYFETTYSPILGANGLWDSFKGRPTAQATLHPDPGTLYYDPPKYPIAGGDQNLLPKKSTSTPQAIVLSFMPDGTASDNVLLFIRDETGLSWVQVWKGGLIRSGDITAPGDFAANGL